MLMPAVDPLLASTLPPLDEESELRTVSRNRTPRLVHMGDAGFRVAARALPATELFPALLGVRNMGVRQLPTSTKSHFCAEAVRSQMSGPISPPPSFVCRWEGCGLEFDTKWKLRYHQIKHRVPRCRCAQCGKMFHDRSKLLRHRNVHDNDRQKRFRCPHDGCGKCFSAERTLQAHRVQHVPLVVHPIVVCPIEGCARKFFHASRLRCHLEMHSEVFSAALYICRS